MSEENKKNVSIEVLHLDEKGYGPEGKHTRREWRAECLENLMAGREQFEEWQLTWHKKAIDIREVDYGVKVLSDERIASPISLNRNGCVLDFVGQEFNNLNLFAFRFLKEARFDFASFNGINNFDEVEFKAHSSFYSSYFNGALSIYNGKFRRYVNFKRSNFNGLFNFDGVIFFDRANFEQSFFIGYAIFEGVTFTKEASFVNVSLLNYATFQNSKFHENLNFTNITSEASSKFDNCHFYGSAIFSESAFKECSFRDAVFEGPFYLINTSINSVYFRAEFKGNVLANRAKFLQNVSFTNSKFFEIADFAESEYFGSAFFTNVEFNQFTNFYKSFFYRQAIFENTKFKNVGHFEKAKFLGFIPAFRGCQIGSTRLEFSDDKFFAHDNFSEDSIKNISFLKRLCDEHGQKDQALNFNAMELRAKRKLAWQDLKIDDHSLNLFPFLPWRLLIKSNHLLSGQFWFCVLTYLYEEVSDFGRSFTKPLFYLVFLFVISYFLGVVSAFENSPAKLTHARQAIFKELSTEYPYKNQTDMIPLSAYRAATEYSLYRSGNFLNFTDNDTNTKSVNMRLFGAQIEPWWARVFGFFKGIIIAVLLFLIALGLRNKYRVS